MSLINQMLQDLETRRAVGEQVALPNFVRALPSEKSSPTPRALVVGITVLLMTAVGVWWTQWKSSASKSDYPLPISASTSPSGAATPADGEAKAPARSSSAATAERPAPVVSPGLGRPDLELKVATILLQSRRGLGREPMPASVATPPITTAAAPMPSQVMPAKPGTGPVVIEKHVVLATPHDRAENEYRKALAVLNQGRINEAIAGLRAALREDATHSVARQSLAAILVEQRRLDEAQATLQEGLAQSPAQPNLAIRLARIQVEQGDTRAAGETLQRSAASGAGNADYRAFYAGVLQRLGEHKAAIDEYQAALRLAPEASIWWMGLGISLEAEGRKVEARDAFQRARDGGNLSVDVDRFVEQKLKQLQ